MRVRFDVYRERTIPTGHGVAWRMQNWSGVLSQSLVWLELVCRADSGYIIDTHVSEETKPSRLFLDIPRQDTTACYHGSVPEDYQWMSSSCERLTKGIQNRNSYFICC